MTSPLPVTDPRAHRCPTCRAPAGTPCRSPQQTKVNRSHQARQDRMIAACNKASAT